MPCVVWGSHQFRIFVSLSRQMSADRSAFFPLVPSLLSNVVTGVDVVHMAVNFRRQGSLLPASVYRLNSGWSNPPLPLKLPPQLRARVATPQGGLRTHILHTPLRDLSSSTSVSSEMPNRVGICLRQGYLRNARRPSLTRRFQAVVVTSLLLCCHGKETRLTFRESS